MEPDYLIDLIQMRGICVNFYIGVCSLLMADPYRQAECKGPSTGGRPKPLAGSRGVHWPPVQCSCT